MVCDQAPMTEQLVHHEAMLRLGAFLGVLLLMMVWEVLAPRRSLGTGRQRRWPANLALALVNTAVLRLLLPAAAVAAALLAADRDWGLFQWLELPGLWAILAGVVLLDLAVYAQHRAFHAVPLLWRLHRMHHTDLDLDTTSGLRFHPLEILLSMLIKVAVVLALGAPVAAVILFEVVLNATALFNHANVRIPVPVDRVLRWLVVTPDMHRIHHSRFPDETDSNFGFNLPWWDRLFASYRAEPRGGHLKMRLGIDGFEGPDATELWALLAQPFRYPTRLPAQSRRR